MCPYHFSSSLYYANLHAYSTSKSLLLLSYLLNIWLYQKCFSRFNENTNWYFFFFVMCQKRYRSFPSAIFNLINNIISKIIYTLYNNHLDFYSSKIKCKCKIIWNIDLLIKYHQSFTKDIKMHWNDEANLFATSWQMVIFIIQFLHCQTLRFIII